MYAYLHNDDASDTAAPSPTVVPLRKKDKGPQDTDKGKIDMASNTCLPCQGKSVLISTLVSHCLSSETNLVSIYKNQVASVAAHI